MNPPAWLAALQRLWATVRAVADRLAPIGHILALVGIGTLALLALDQSHDVLRSLIDEANFALSGAEVPGAIRRSLFLFIAAVLTGISAWYWAAILSPADSPPWLTWLRRFLGVLPLLTLAASLVLLTNQDWGEIWIGLGLLLLAILLLLDFFINRRESFNLKAVHADIAGPAVRGPVWTALVRLARSAALAALPAIILDANVHPASPFGLFLGLTLAVYVLLAALLGWPPFRHRPPFAGLWTRITAWLNHEPRWFQRIRLLPGFATANSTNAELAFIGLTLGTSLLALLVFQWSPSRIEAARYIGPGGLMFGALGLIIPVLSLLVFILRRLKVPALLLFLGLYLATNSCMDNAAVSRLDGSKQPPRPSLEDALATWERQQPPEEPLHLILVASAGGASRAAAWTGTVLSELDITSQDRLQRRIFAISGVSGGTLGAVGYVAVLDQPITSRQRCLRDALGADHLSPAFAGLFYIDLVQRFLPVPLFDSRATLLEDSFNRSFTAEPDVPEDPGCRAIPAFAEDIQSLWAGRLPSKSASPTAPWRPLVFANGTETQTGRRIITAPVRSAPRTHEAPNWLSSGYDAYDLHPWRISAATTVTNSARFPVVSPAGTFLDSRGRPSARIVDGGYFENGGLATIDDLVTAIHAWDCTTRAADTRTARPLTIHLLSLDSEPAGTPAPPPPTNRWTGDIGNILGAFAATRGAHGEATRKTLVISAGTTSCRTGGPGATVRPPLPIHLPTFRWGKVEHRSTSVNWALSSVARDMMSAMLAPDVACVRATVSERGLTGRTADTYREDLLLAHHRFAPERRSLNAFLADAGLPAQPRTCPPALPETKGSR